MKKQIATINIISILTLVIVLIPLLLISQYNYPSADDWLNSADGYQVIQSGKGFWELCVTTADKVKDIYLHWDGRFSIPLFSSLQPGIWGEKYYGIVAYMMFGAIVLSEICLCRFCLCATAKRENRWYYLPVIIPVLAMQILYCPSPSESFYWYTGAVSYTFVYGLSLVLLVLFCKLGMQVSDKKKYVITAIAACILALLVGGGNFATSLSCFLTLCILSIGFLIYHRKAFYKTWYVTLIMGASLLLCIFAPGNIYRINFDFNGSTTVNALEVVWMSLVRSAVNIYLWSMPIKMWLMILFTLPFVWMAVKNIDYGFRLPGLFTLVTFGLYSSQIAATMYVDGTTGPPRMEAILWYSYVIWLVGNISYWAGWVSKRTNRLKSLIDKGGRFGKYLIAYCGLIGIALVVIIYVFDINDLSSYKAYYILRQGWAQQYAAEWDARIEVLRDENVKEVEFVPLTVKPEMLMFTDLYLQEKTRSYWVNEACATYYGKEYVHIVIPEAP